MFEQKSIDLGMQPGLTTGPRTQSAIVDLARSPTWRRMLMMSSELERRGCPADEIVRRTLGAMRPCADSPNRQIAANATLRKDQWIEYTARVIRAYQQRLVAVGDLLDRGLRTTFPNPFGKLIWQREQESEMTDAHVSMYAATPPQDDRVTYNIVGVPVPVISKGFNLDERVLSASQNGGGDSLDTTNAAAATRVVTEKLENLLFAGGLTFGGSTLYGYTNHPSRNQGSLSASWLTLSTTEPKAILDDVLAMMQACHNDNVDGPFMLYIPRDWEIALENDYFATVAASPAAVTGMSTPNRSIRERVEAIPGITGIRSTKELTAGVVLVAMDAEVVEVGFGFEPTLITWEGQGGMSNHFRVLSIMTFRVSADYAGRSGVAHYVVAG